MPGERLNHQQTNVNPENRASSSYRIGAKARLLARGPHLNPTYQAKEITPAMISPLAKRSLKAEGNASNYESSISGSKDRAAFLNDYSIVLEKLQPTITNPQKQNWVEVLGKYGIDVQNRNASGFHDTYVAVPQENGTIASVPRQEGVRNFISDVIDDYTENGKINRTKLIQDIDAIEWVAKSFGKVSSEAIVLHILGEVDVQTEPDFLQKANAKQPDGSLRTNQLDQDEDRILQFIWEHGNDQSTATTTQQQADHTNNRPTPDPSTPTGNTDHERERNEKRKQHIQDRKIWVERTRLRKVVSKQNRQVEATFKGSVAEYSNPREIAQKLKELYPQTYGRQYDLAVLEENIKNEQHETEQLMTMLGLDKKSLTNLAQNVLIGKDYDYEGFLEKRYGITKLSQRQYEMIIPLYGKLTTELFKPIDDTALAFVDPRYPIIFLNLSGVLNQTVDILSHAGKIAHLPNGQFSVNPTDVGEVMGRLLKEIIPHEYTHLRSEVSYDDLHVKGQAESVLSVPSRVGVNLAKIGGSTISDTGEIKLDYRERGKELMEAITVELTDRWAKSLHNQSRLEINAYATERDVLQELTNKLAQEKNIPEDKAFGIFVSAYFNKYGLRSLEKTLSEGKVIKTVDAHKQARIERLQFLPILYALIDLDSNQRQQHINQPITYYSALSFIRTGKIRESQKRILLQLIQANQIHVSKAVKRQLENLPIITIAASQTGRRAA